MSFLKDFDSKMNNLLNNKSLLMKYCPSNCSYYTQTVQRVWKTIIQKKKTVGRKQKKIEETGYCSDNYIIVHCGPKKEGKKYNLNIREITSLCSDFGTCSY